MHCRLQETRQLQELTVLLAQTNLQKKLEVFGIRIDGGWSKKGIEPQHLGPIGPPSPPSNLVL